VSIVAACSRQVWFLARATAPRSTTACAPNRAALAYDSLHAPPTMDPGPDVRTHPALLTGRPAGHPDRPRSFNPRAGRRRARPRLAPSRSPAAERAPLALGRRPMGRRMGRRGSTPTTSRRRRGARAASSPARVGRERAQPVDGPRLADADLIGSLPLASPASTTRSVRRTTSTSNGSRNRRATLSDIAPSTRAIESQLGSPDDRECVRAPPRRARSGRCHPPSWRRSSPTAVPECVESLHRLEADGGPVGCASARRTSRRRVTMSGGPRVPEVEVAFGRGTRCHLDVADGRCAPRQPARRSRFTSLGLVQCGDAAPQ
jgi:hypothetical protein